MHSCEVGWNRGLRHSTPFTGVFYFLEELMLDVKRIRNDFDALAEKVATRGVAAETLNELKELDVKRRELLIKSEELKAQRNIASDGHRSRYEYVLHLT